MSNKKRLEFIQTNHPKLYALLEMTVPMSVENTEHMNASDIFDCNRQVSLYCQTEHISDPELCKLLLFTA